MAHSASKWKFDGVRVVHANEEVRWADNIHPAPKRK